MSVYGYVLLVEGHMVMQVAQSPKADEDWRRFKWDSRPVTRRLFHYCRKSGGRWPRGAWKEGGVWDADV